MKDSIVQLFQSVKNYLSLVRLGKLHLKRDRLHTSYHIESYGDFEIFRETESTKKYTENPVILVVGFRLKWIKGNPFFHWLFQRVCIITTPFWSGFSGFHIKLWMVDQKTKNYLGIYEWYGKEHCKAYVDVLSNILIPLSVKKSVSSVIISTESFEDYLTKRKISSGM